MFFYKERRELAFELRNRSIEVIIFTLPSLLMRYFRAENLTKIYTDKPIIDQLTFSVEKGKKIALVAKNGGGKSTLLRLMMGSLDKTDGKIERKRGLKI